MSEEKGSGAAAPRTALHTPGPWEAWPVCKDIDTGKDVLFVRRRGDEACRWICNIIGGRSGHQTGLDEANANAALIAAAPTLAGALKRLTDFIAESLEGRSMNSIALEQEWHIALKALDSAAPAAPKEPQP